MKFEMQDGTPIYSYVIFCMLHELNELYDLHNNQSCEMIREAKTYGQKIKGAQNKWYGTNTIGLFFKKLHENKAKKTIRQLYLHRLALSYNSHCQSFDSFYECKADQRHKIEQNDPTPLAIVLGYSSFVDYVEKSIKKISSIEEKSEEQILLLKAFSLQKETLQNIKKHLEQDVNLARTSILKIDIEQNEIPETFWWCYLSRNIITSEKVKGIRAGIIGFYTDNRVQLIFKYGGENGQKYKDIYTGYYSLYNSILTIHLIKKDNNTKNRNERPTLMYKVGNNQICIDYMDVFLAFGSFLGNTSNDKIVYGGSIMQRPQNITKYHDLPLDRVDINEAIEEIDTRVKYRLANRRYETFDMPIKSKAPTNKNLEIFKKYIGTYFAYNVTKEEGDAKLISKSYDNFQIRQSVIRINGDFTIDCDVSLDGHEYTWSGRVSVFDLNIEGILVLTIFNKETSRYYWKIMLDVSKKNKKNSLKGIFVFSGKLNDTSFKIGNIIFIKASKQRNHKPAFLQIESPEYKELDVLYELSNFFKDDSNDFINFIQTPIHSRDIRLEYDDFKELTGTYITFFYNKADDAIYSSVLLIHPSTEVELYSIQKDSDTILHFRGEIGHIRRGNLLFSIPLLEKQRNIPVYFLLRLRKDGRNRVFHGLYNTVNEDPELPISGREVIVKLDSEVWTSKEKINKLLVKNNIKVIKEYEEKLKIPLIDYFLQPYLGNHIIGFSNENLKNGIEINAIGNDVFSSAILLALRDNETTHFSTIKKKLTNAITKYGFNNIRLYDKELKDKTTLGKYDKDKEVKDLLKIKSLIKT